MNAKTLLVMSALALAAGTALANESASHPGPLTRTEVRQAVLAAEAAGQLIPAGEGELRFAPPRIASTLSRAEVRRDVVAAERSGQLLPAGEGELRTPVIDTQGAVQLARSAVKAETLRALAAGEVIPAGEGTNDHEPRDARAWADRFVAKR